MESGKENTKARKGFIYWFNNVFLYHYLKPTILGDHRSARRRLY